MKDAVAILPWGDVIEDFLDPLELTVREFADQMTGGWLFGYAAALQSQGYRPIIVAASSAVQSTTEFVHKGTGAPIWLVPGTSSYAIRNPELRALSRWARTPVSAIGAVLRNERCRALIVQEYEDARFDRLVRLGARLGLPVYATFQGGDITLSRVEKLIRRRSMHNCAGLIIPSAKERQRVAATYNAPPPTVAVIPNPLDCDEWVAGNRDEARQALGIARDRFVAVTHGRIDIYRKGLDVLLSAWSGPGELVLIGSGQDSARLSDMLAGRTDVRWIDSYTTDRRLIRSWLSAADLYVTASRIEGMPVAPLEAMACGLPIVATDAHGLSDVLEGGEAAGGLLVPRGDGRALAEAIARLRSDPQLRTRLGRAARKHVERKFGLQQVGRALSELLRDPSAR